MKSFIQNIFAAAFVLSFSSAVFAQGRWNSYASSTSYNYSNEIITNWTNSTLTTGKECKNCDNVTDLKINGAYLRTLNSNFQLGGVAGIESVSGPKSETLLTLAALGVYNFEPNFKDSIFVQGEIGIYPVWNDDHTSRSSQIGLLIGVGKRFSLWDRISYMPSLNLVKKGDLDVGFDIELVNFSFMF